MAKPRLIDRKPRQLVPEERVDEILRDGEVRPLDSDQFLDLNDMLVAIMNQREDGHEAKETKAKAKATRTAKRASGPPPARVPLAR